MQNAKTMILNKIEKKISHLGTSRARNDQNHEQKTEKIATSFNEIL